MALSKKVPDGLNGREYSILTIQYLMLQWLPQASESHAKSMKCGVEDFHGTPFDGMSKDDLARMNMLSSVVHGSLTAGEHVSSAAEYLRHQLNDGMAKANTVLDHAVEGNQPLKDAKEKITDAWKITGQQLTNLLGKTVENVLSSGAPSRDVPQGLSAKEYLDLGIQYKNIGWTEQSRDALERAIELDRDGAIGKEAHRFMISRLPHHPVPHAAVQRNISGYNLMQANRREEAKTVFEALIKDYPTFEWPFSNLGRLYINSGDTHRARDLLWHALDINPHYANAWCNLAIAKIVDSDFDDAENCLEKAMSLDPKNPVCEHLNAMLSLIRQFRHPKT